MNANEFDLYEVGGYGDGRIGFDSKIGILSVDFMNGVTDPEARMGQSPLAQASVAKTDLRDMPRWKNACIHATSIDSFALG